MARPLLALLLAALLVACAGPQAAAPTATLALPTATPAPTVPLTPASTATPPPAAALEAGARIDIGGRALFLQCSAPIPGAPTVILEAGLAADHTAWEQVQPAAARYARVCSYDRAGLGVSNPGPPPRDAASADSTVIVVPDSGHDLPRQRPDMIVLAIQAVLAAVGQR